MTQMAKAALTIHSSEIVKIATMTGGNSGDDSDDDISIYVYPGRGDGYCDTGYLNLAGVNDREYDTLDEYTGSYIRDCENYPVDSADDVSSCYCRPLWSHVDPLLSPRGPLL